jgi:hypothetical protein
MAAATETQGHVWFIGASHYHDGCCGNLIISFAIGSFHSRPQVETA